MFDEIFKAAKSAAELADAAAGALLKPVRDGADFMTEGLREVAKDDSDDV